MCRLKNRHFTLGGTCAHLDHLAVDKHRDIGMLKPVCAHNKESVVVFFSPSLLNIKGLYPISWLSGKSKTNENIPASGPLLRFREEEVRSRNEGRRGGRRTFEYRPQHGCQKKRRRRRKEVNEWRVDLTGRLFLRPELSVCVYSAS